MSGLIVETIGGGVNQRSRGPTWVEGVVKVPVEEKSSIFYLGVWWIGLWKFLI